MDWCHKMANVLDKLPKRLQPKARRALREILYAATTDDAEESFDAFVDEFSPKYGAVARFNPGASRTASPTPRSRHHGVGLRPAELGHPVEGVTPDHGLSRLRVAVPRLQAASEH